MWLLSSVTVNAVLGERVRLIAIVEILLVVVKDLRAVRPLIGLDFLGRGGCRLWRSWTDECLGIFNAP